jgi:hypothetical protein
MCGRRRNICGGWGGREFVSRGKTYLMNGVHRLLVKSRFCASYRNWLNEIAQKDTIMNKPIATNPTPSDLNFLGPPK